MGERDELERMAARGRELRERAAATPEPSVDERAAARYRLRGAVSAYVRWQWWVLGVALGVLVALVVAKFLPSSSDEDTIDAPGFAAFVLACVPIIVSSLLRRPLGELAIRREEAWVRALPFPLAGHLEALASNVTEGRYVIEITFAPSRAAAIADAPTFRDAAAAARPGFDETLVSDALRAVGAELSAGKTAMERHVETTFDFGDTSVTTNAHARAWTHRVVPALIAIHARHPIASARVRGFGR